MKRHSVDRFLLITSCCALLATGGCDSSSQGGGETELLSVVAISRHGIRSPTSRQDTMNLYTLRPQGFPLWPAPADVAGNLSTVGQQNVIRQGAWYRDFYADLGLLPQRGSCPTPGTVFVYADVFERTLRTAQGYLDGMFQSDDGSDCGIQVSHAAGQMAADPYIDTAAARVCAIDTAADLAAFNAGIGGNPAALVNAYLPQLQMLQAVTQCCAPAACATADNPNPSSCTLLELPTSVTTAGAVSFAPGSLFAVADNLTESLELEYVQGMPDSACATTPGAQCVGWGAIPPGGLSDMTKLHVLNMVGLSCQLPSFAQVGSSNLMWQLVGTMDQASGEPKNPDILAPVGNKFSLFVGHDENLAAIAGFLGGVTWQAEGFQPNDPGPAGALVFELHKVKQSGKLVVRLFYVIAALDQMRNGTPLTLATPPQRIALPIPACDGRLDCPYEQFKTFVADHVRRDCLVRKH